MGPLDREYIGSVVDDDGTSNLILYKTQNPVEGDWTRVYEFGGAGTTKRDLHMTASGTLLTVRGGSILRSTDGGASFSAVNSLSGGSIWSFSEYNGNIIASEEDNMNLWQSTDDGASWSLLADSSDFPNYPLHLHRCRYHPVSGYIITTGGDGASTKGYYRSADGGSTWDFFSPVDTDQQWTDVGIHPNDGNTYFLGSDDGGYIVKVTDDGGSSIDWDIVANANTEDSDDTRGTFALPTFTNSRLGTSYYAFLTIANTYNHLFCSTDLLGKAWRSVGHIRTGSVHNATTSRGEGETIIDISNCPVALFGRDYLRTEQATEHVYGSQLSMPVDHRSLQHDIYITGGGASGPALHYRADENGFPFVMENESDRGLRFQQLSAGDARLQTADGGSSLMEWQTSVGINRFLARTQFTNVGDNLEYRNAEDLTQRSPNSGEFAKHDGSDGTYSESMCFEQGGSWFNIADAQTM